jgi:two-component system sensor histidine kinase YesM
MIRHYLSIVCNVYNLRIDTLIDIPPQLEDLYLVKLFMQPIVENAVIHGIRQSGGGILQITGRREDDLLIFTVTDDGAGIEPHILETIERYIQDESPTEVIGYGIANVLKRLRLFYPACKFTINSTPDEGTKVTITLPAMTEIEMQRLLDRRHVEI